ncbi:testis expressed 54 [Phyllostomus discolor]|uniref:Testis expressed 54 n=1 Tax=Phyllostomus discolor TaxID=89673 RepID=A0A834A8I6_9CHIR|nr:testis expressed 54 [Phyllostomus discolor]
MGCCQDKDFSTGGQAQEAESEEVGEGGNTDTPGEPREWEGGRWEHRYTWGPREWERGKVQEGGGRAEISDLITFADAGGADVDSTNQRDRKSNESLLITVLWRRLSLFSRRGSKRQSGQSQKRGSKQEGILEEPEKG